MSHQVGLAKLQLETWHFPSGRGRSNSVSLLLLQAGASLVLKFWSCSFIGFCTDILSQAPSRGVSGAPAAEDDVVPDSWH